MRFESRQIKGRGRARTLGFPTINLYVPEGIKLDYGIYGVNVFIGANKYLGAMHYGRSPTFNDLTESCEVYLVDYENNRIPDTFEKKILVETIKFIRGVIKFDNEDELIKRINQDVKEIKTLLSNSL